VLSPWPLTHDHKLQGSDALLLGTWEGLAVGQQLCSAVAGAAGQEHFVPGGWRRGDVTAYLSLNAVLAAAA